MTDHAQTAQPPATAGGALCTQSADAMKSTPSPVEPREIGGREGPEPTRYGDWEMRGRCIDF